MSRLAPGGFVGVDIFFVISGFLITKIIYEEIREGRYSVIGFYERRARRIFPALFVVFAFCAVATTALGLASQVKDTSSSIISTALFVSNFFFYQNYGYFDQAADLNPLLHTWSLSVEEQFYIAFPLLALAIRSIALSRQHILFYAVLIASLVYSIVLVTTDRNAAFYLLQSRAWELLLGSVLAIGAVPKIISRKFAEATGAIGIALIVYSIFSLDGGSDFPGLNAILPCLGAAALLHSGYHRTIAAKLLSAAPMRLVGLVSYSLYLWHWPIIVFYTYFREPSPQEKLVVIIAMLIISWFSWRYVEKPFRTKPHWLNSRQTVFVAATMIILAAAGSVTWAALPGLTRSRRDHFLSYMSQDWYPPMRAGSCFLSSRYQLADFDRSKCLATVPNKKNILLLGDSHAADLWPGLKTTNSSSNLLQATASGCKPLLISKGATRCTALMRFIFDEFLPNNRMDTIILSARWDSTDLDALRPTLELLTRFSGTVVLVGPAPEFIRPLPRLLAQRADPIYANRFRSNEATSVEIAFKHQTFGPAVRYLSLQDTLCNPMCLVWTADESPVQFDYSHFTTEGSALLGPNIMSLAEKN